MINLFRKKITVVFSVVLSLFFSSLKAEPQIIYFSQLSIGSDAFWNDLLTWDPMIIPNADNAVVVFPTVSVAPTMDLIGISPTVNMLFFYQPGVTINNAGTLNFRGGAPGQGIVVDPGTLSGAAIVIESDITLDSSTLTLEVNQPLPTFQTKGSISGGSFSKKGIGLWDHSSSTPLGINVEVQEANFSLSGTATTYDYVISGAGNFIQGSLTNELTISQPQTYLGQTVLNRGLTLSGSGSIENTNSVVIGSSATLTLSPGIGARNIANLAQAGTVALNDNTLTITQGTDTAFSGTITGDSSSGLVIAGTSSITFSGTLSYTGTTSITGGELVLSGSTNLDSTSSISFDNSGRLTIESGAGSRTLNNISSSSSSSSIVLNDNSVILAQSTSATFAGGITGSGGVEKTEAAGTLTLTGSQSYSGATTVSAGALTLSGEASLGSSSSVSVASGATLNVNTTSQLNALQGSGSVVLGSGNTTTLAGASSTFSGVLSGGGGIDYSGTDTLTLTGANTYTGSTTVSSGTLTISGSGVLNTSSDVSVEGTLIFDSTSGTQTISNLSGSGDIAVNGTSLTVNQSSADGTLSGALSGTGNFIKTGSNNLILSGTNTNTGSLTVSSGNLVISGESSFQGATSIASGATLTLSGSGALEDSSSIEVSGALGVHYGDKTLKDFTGSGEITLNGNTLTISEGGGTFSGQILNGGSSHNSKVTKSGSGSSTLSGSNTFLGPLKVTGGTLTLSNTNAYTGDTIVSSGAALTITGSGSIANSGASRINGTLTFDGTSGSKGIQSLSGSGSLALNGTAFTITQNTDGEFSGVISGSSPIAKSGSGSLTLSGSNTNTGLITLSAGTLSVTGSTDAGVTVNSGTLKGNGTIGSGSSTVTNSGFVEPGNSIGTLTISGHYTQESDGTLNIEISPGSTDLLDVSGTATLAGTVSITPSSGSYQKDAVYTFLNAGTRTGTFDTLSQVAGITGVLNYTGTTVTYTLLKAHFALPVSKSDLKGNAKSIANYLFRSGVQPSNSDLDSVYHTLLNLSIPNFPTALRKLGPTQFGAFPLVNLQSDVRLAQSLVDNWKNGYICQQCEDSEENKEDLNQASWIEPLVYSYTQDAYKQGGIEEQIKFNAITYGASTGLAFYLRDYFCLAGELAYTHTNLNWEKRAGNSRWSSIYLGPAVGWFLDRPEIYFDVVVLGAVHFYDVERRIVFPGLERVARNKHPSFDILGRMDGGIKLSYQKAFIQPEWTLSALTFFEPKYKERGANALDLTVFSNTETYLRPEVSLRAGLELSHKSICFSPILRVGWVSNIPLTNGVYHARLTHEQFAIGNQFPVLSFHRTTNQLVAGAELGIEGPTHVFSMTFNANYLDRNMVQEGKFRFEWWF